MSKSWVGLDVPRCLWTTPKQPRCLIIGVQRFRMNKFTPLPRREAKVIKAKRGIQYKLVVYINYTLVHVDVVKASTTPVTPKQYAYMHGLICHKTFFSYWMLKIQLGKIQTRQSTNNLDTVWQPEIQSRNVSISWKKESCYSFLPYYKKVEPSYSFGLIVGHWTQSLPTHVLLWLVWSKFIRLVSQRAYCHKTMLYAPTPLINFRGSDFPTTYVNYYSIYCFYYFMYILFKNNQIILGITVIVPALETAHGIVLGTSTLVEYGLEVQ